MSEQHGWYVSEEAAEIYERNAVPAAFAQWAPQVAAAARIASLDRVLDVGCGTGVLARAVADLVADERQVTGIDLNESMLAVAQRLRPEIKWQQEDATHLPFADNSFDVVISQFVLMHILNPLAALKEMVRVLRPGGRLAHAIWGPFERATGFVILAEIVGRRCGQAAVDDLMSQYVLSNEDSLRDLFTEAGAYEVAIELRPGSLTFPSIEVFIEARVKGTPLGVLFDEENYQGLLQEAQEGLQQFRTSDGIVALPQSAYIVTAVSP